MSRHASSAAITALAMLALLTACGGAAPPPVVATLPPRPTGEPRSFLAPRDFWVVIDTAAVRMTPFADEARDALRNAGLVRRFTGSGTLDLVHDVDWLGASTREATWGSSGVMGDRWRVVLRHHFEDVEAVRRLERAALDNGGALSWRESQGVRSAPVPGWGDMRVPHVVLLSALHEMVIVPEDELIDAVAVSRDHALRREIADQIVEPAFALPPRVFIAGETTTVPAALASSSVVALRGLGRWTGTELELEVVVQMTDDAAAIATVNDLTVRLAAVRGNNPFLSMLGLTGLVDRLAITADGSEVRVTTRGSGDEARSLARALGAVFRSS